MKPAARTRRCSSSNGQSSIAMMTGTRCRHQHRLLPSSSVAGLVGLVAVVALTGKSSAFISPLLHSSSSNSYSLSALSCDRRRPSSHKSLVPSEALGTHHARIRGKIRSTRNRRSSISLLVSLDSPSSSDLLHSNSTTFSDVMLHQDHDLKASMEQHNIDINTQLEHDYNMGAITHLRTDDDLGVDIDLVQTSSSPFVSISYDEHGMVQADATITTTTATTTMALSDFSLATINSAHDEAAAVDYPQFIQYLFQKDANGQTLASKLFNLALLAASFGYVFVSVFNIDKGMTRGWSPAEIGMRIPLDTWASYENSLSEKPVATKTIINIVIYLLGDWLSQTIFQKKNVLDFDASRTLKNGFVGMCFGPAVHEYYEFSDWILPVDGLTLGITNRAFKILMDQTIYLSVKCSIYIIAVGLLNGESAESGAENVKNRLKPIMFTAWKFWPLVHCVTYGLIPARHRILWVNSVDLVWNAILASKARGDDDVNKEIEAESRPDGIETVIKENVPEQIGSIQSIFHSLQEGEDRTTITVTGKTESNLSDEIIPTETSDTMSLQVKDE